MLHSTLIKDCKEIKVITVFNNLNYKVTKLIKLILIEFGKISKQINAEAGLYNNIEPKKLKIIKVILRLGCPNPNKTNSSLTHWAYRAQFLPIHCKLVPSHKPYISCQLVPGMMDTKCY